jgi:signal transduction histidine kinase
MAGILVEDYGAGLDGDGRMYIDRIAANAGKMQDLLDDLLDLSRIGRLDTDYTLVDLDQVVREVTEQLRHTLALRQAEVQVDGRLPRVCANRTRITQIMTNLIDNAVKYTPPERAPRVRIGAVDRLDHWQISVQDNGVGIPAAFHDKIFGIFQRLPAGKALNPRGSGVGLAIVARTVETHGGTYWLESEEGMGTTFHFTLPKRELASPESGDAVPIATAAGVWNAER